MINGDADSGSGHLRFKDTDSFRVFEEAVKVISANAERARAEADPNSQGSIRIIAGDHESTSNK